MIADWILIWLLLSVPAQGGATSKLADDFVLQIGVNLFGGSSVRGTALLDEADNDRTGHESVKGFLYGPPDLCGCASSAWEPAATNNSARSSNSKPSIPGWGWFVTGQVLTRTADGLTVRVSWQRRWWNGSPVASSADQAETLTIHPDSPVTLDEIRAAASPCGVTDAYLRIAVVHEAQTLGGSGGGSGAKSADLGSSSLGRGSRAMSAGSIADSAGLQDTAVIVSPDARSDTTLRSPVHLVPIPAASYEAEVWLVHTQPNAQEVTVRLASHLDGSGHVFEFPPVSISTPTGAAQVSIASKLRPMAAPDGRIMLRAAIARVITPGHIGSSVKAIPMPRPSDVISFEPPSEDATIGAHQFTLRVRLTPSK